MISVLDPSFSLIISSEYVIIIGNKQKDVEKSIFLLIILLKLLIKKLSSLFIDLFCKTNQ